MRDIKKTFDLLSVRHCWLSKAFHINIFNRSRETLFFVPPGDQTVMQLSCYIPAQVSYFKDVHWRGNR